MPEKTPAAQIPFRYRNVDSRAGVTRKTAKRLAETLGVDETQVIHMALYQLAVRVLPQYEQDEGPLTKAQIRQIAKLTEKANTKSVRSSLIDMGPA